MKTITVKEYLDNLKKTGYNEIIKYYENKNHGRSIAKKDLDFGTKNPPEFLISPLMCKGDITILYASKGLGKTLLALSIAYMVALGKSLFSLWKCKKPTPTLYLDGEIGESGMKARKDSCRRCFNLEKNHDSDLWFISDRLNLYSNKDRSFIDSEIIRINSSYAKNEEIKFIVIDNLTSMQEGKDYATGWNNFFTWAKRLQNNGISLLILFHANKDDSMRGSQMKLINADNVIFVDRLESDNGSNKTGHLKRNSKKTPKNKQQDTDRTRICMKICFENLRNNKFPDSYTPLEVEYSIPGFKWTMLNYSEYCKKILSEQSKYFSDKEMSEFWGESNRNMRELRNRYGITKYSKE